jgi:hypothetical protein
VWLLRHKLRDVLQYSRWHFSFLNRINKEYLYNWKTFPSNAGLYWSSRRPEPVLLHIFQSSCSFCYFKGLDIWIAFVINKSVVKTELFWAITQRVVGIPYWPLRIQEVYATDTIVCFAEFPVLRIPPRLISSAVTTLTVRVDDFSYDGDGHPTEYVLQFVVSDRISTCSQ